MKEAAAAGFFGKAAEPDKSVLLQALGYEGRVKMPPQGKLPPETIAAIREWVAAGAPTPAVTPSAGNSLAGTGVRPVATARRDHRCGQELLGFQADLAGRAARVRNNRTGPRIRSIGSFSRNLEKNGLEPAPPADKTTLLRRATFDLTGLPPTEKEIAGFSCRQISECL